jgi:2-(1,2-epoxy-1,2-dihydrophenyl)acetyl-CoA isomerase
MTALTRFPGLELAIDGATAVATLLETAYSLDNLGSIARAVEALEQRTEISALVLRGTADRFHTGASMPLLDHLRQLPDSQRTALIEHGQGNVRSLLKTPLLTVAYVDGFAAGGGVDLMLACDLALVTPNARVNLFYSKLGVIPDDGALFLLAERVGWPRALRLCEESASWNAQECVALGVADRPLDASADGAQLIRALRRELRLPRSTRAALKALRWLEIEPRFERHLSACASTMSKLLTLPEQQELLRRTAAAQRAHAAPPP